MAKKSTAKRLGETLGGEWEYDRSMGTWYCNDGKRRVSKICAGVDEFDNVIGPPQLWLYGDGVPRRAEEHVIQFRISAKSKGGA